MPSPIEETPREQALPSAESLIAHGRPRVLRGLCRDWPLVRHARESDTAFAQAIAAHDNGTPVDALRMEAEEDGIVGYTAGLDAFNYRHFRVSVTEILQRLAAYSRSERSPGLAMQSAQIAACLPGLLPSLSLPLLASDAQPRLWMGNRVVTPAHFDSSHNIAVVACGRRRFTLFPPDQVANLYIGPLDFAPTVAAMSIARLDAVDDPRYPRLREALAHAFVAELEPGDAIYIPPVWWHHVESLERLNALVNYWWRPAAFPGHVAEPGLEALAHCLLAFRWMPQNERAAWKAIIDHFVFDPETNADHIPEARRGVLSPLTAETQAKLRKMAGK